MLSLYKFMLKWQFVLGRLEKTKDDEHRLFQSTDCWIFRVKLR